MSDYRAELQNQLGKVIDQSSSINFGSEEKASCHVPQMSVDSEIIENFKMIDNQRSMLRQKGTENLHNQKPAMQKRGSLILAPEQSITAAIAAVNETQELTYPGRLEHALPGRNAESQETLKEARHFHPSVGASPPAIKRVSEQQETEARRKPIDDSGLSRQNSHKAFKSLIAEYQSDLKSEFQMVNEKIAKFKNQFLQQSQASKILVPKTNGIQVYKANKDNLTSSLEQETTPSSAQEETALPQDPFQQQADDIKSKLNLSYEKLDLQRKLADMMSTITNFKSAYEPESKDAVKPDAPASTKPPQDVAKGVKKPIKSIIKPKADAKPKSPLRVVVKGESRVPKTSTTERAKIVMERSSRSGHSALSGRSGVSNYSARKSLSSSQATQDFVRQFEERSRSDIRRHRIGEFTKKLADSYYGEPPQNQTVKDQEQMSPPKPHELPRLVTHQASPEHIDQRYMQEMISPRDQEASPRRQPTQNSVIQIVDQRESSSGIKPFPEVRYKTVDQMNLQMPRPKSLSMQESNSQFNSRFLPRERSSPMRSTSVNRSPAKASSNNELDLLLGQPAASRDLASTQPVPKMQFTNPVPVPQSLRLKSGMEVEREERARREGEPAQTLSQRREGYCLYEAEEKTQDFCKRLQEQRQSRNEDRVNKQDLVKLREENAALKEKCHKYEKLLETSSDPEILRKFFDIEMQSKASQEEKKETEQKLETKSKELDLMREQYEAMKKSQFALTDMNKKLIERHHSETDHLNNQLQEARDELKDKRRKVDKYVDIVRTFTQQMQMFESFQASSESEIAKLNAKIQSMDRERLKLRAQAEQANAEASIARRQASKMAQTQALEFKSPVSTKMPSKSPTRSQKSLSKSPARQLIISPTVQRSQSNSIPFNPPNSQSKKVMKANQKRKTLSSALKNLSFGQPMHDSNKIHSGRKEDLPTSSSKKKNRRQHNFSMPVHILTHPSTMHKEASDASSKRSRQNYLNNDLQDYPPLQQSQTRNSQGPPHEREGSCLSSIRDMQQTGVYKIFGTKFDHSRDEDERSSHQGFIQVIQNAEPPLTERNLDRSKKLESTTASVLSKKKQPAGGQKTYRNYIKQVEKVSSSRSQTSKDEPSKHPKKKKMVPLSSRDYSSRLKEMQQRLEKAKMNYGSSRSPTPNRGRQRSRSPSPLCSDRRSKSPFASCRSSITPTRNQELSKVIKAKTVVSKMPQYPKPQQSSRKSARLFKTQNQLQEVIRQQKHQS